MPSPVLAAAAALALASAIAAPLDGPYQTASLIPHPPRLGKPRPTSTKKPTRPTPKPTATPAPAATPMPAPSLAPASPAAPEPTPVPEAPPLAPGAPTVEGHLGTWALPTGAGGGYDFGPGRAAYNGGATLWWGDWGLAAEATVFNTVYANFQTTPYFQANTWMTDVLVRRRFDQGRYQVFAGYRGLGQGDVNFGTLGFGLDRPVLTDWLSLTGRLQYGMNFGGSYVVDGDLGLAADFDPVRVQLGFRHLALQAGGRPLFQINGPTAGLALRF